MLLVLAHQPVTKPRMMITAATTTIASLTSMLSPNSHISFSGVFIGRLLVWVNLAEMRELVSSFRHHGQKLLAEHLHVQ